LKVFSSYVHSVYRLNLDKKGQNSEFFIYWSINIGKEILKENNSKMNAEQNYLEINQAIEFAPNKYRISHLDNKIPVLYSIVATKKIDK